MYGDVKTRKSLKIATVVAVLLLALGAIVFVYAQSGFTVFRNSDEQKQMNIENMQAFFGSCNNSNATMPWGHMGRMSQMRENGFPLSEGFLQNATLSNVTGTVVLVYRDTLILDTSSGQTRILVPETWILNNETVSGASLFNGTFASTGQTVTITVLESNVFSNTSFSINIMMGYEAVDATGTHAYAVLPFNIQPSS
jgi:hypothetical protein